MEELKPKKSEHNKELDTFIVYFKENPENPIETIEGPYGGHVLFEIDSKTKELVSVTIYSFSNIKRHLFKDFFILATNHAIKKWITTIADSFRSGRNISLHPA